MVLSEKALYNNAKEEGRVDAKGNVIVESKPKPDPIDKSLTLRVA
jgi:hypothetical protein